MADNKNYVASAATDEQVKEVLNNMGIADGDKVTVVAGKAMKVGDEFEITGVDKVGNTTDGDFIPFVFTTSIGKTIGCKNFGDIDWNGAENVPVLGRTATEVVKYMMWAKANKIKFVVDRIKLYDEKTLADGTKYTPKDVILSVA